MTSKTLNLRRRTLVEKLAKVTAEDFAAFGVHCFTPLVNEAREIVKHAEKTSERKA